MSLWSVIWACSPASLIAMVFEVFKYSKCGLSTVMWVTFDTFMVLLLIFGASDQCVFIISRTNQHNTMKTETKIQIFGFIVMPTWCRTGQSREGVLTFSSRALWCSNRDLSALSTSTSLETPAGDWACLFTTVILSERSWRDTRHSRCSKRS